MSYLIEYSVLYLPPDSLRLSGGIARILNSNTVLILISRVNTKSSFPSNTKSKHQSSFPSYRFIA